jgi:hypothetical protein
MQWLTWYLSQFDANSFKFISQQDWQTGHLPSVLHDRMGNYIRSYRRLPELWGARGLSLFPGLHR